MADNAKASTDPSVATDEIGGKHHQRVKVQHGADGSATDVSAASPLPVDGTVILGGGTAAIGKLGANSGVDIGDVTLTAGSNLVGDVGLGVRTSGGATPFRSIDLDESEEEVKASAGQVYGYYFANLSESWRFVKLYNATAANVTVGETTPVLTWPLPPESAGHCPLPVPIELSTAITVAATTGVGDDDTGAPGANEVVLDLYYA